MNREKLCAICVTFLIALMGTATGVFAANKYVDSAVKSSGDGLSWQTAWKSLSDISGLSAGDTVYISGGSTSAAYNISGWNPTGGSSGNAVTYKIGLDPGHTGIATFDCGGGAWLFPTHANVVISGDAGDGEMHFALKNCSEGIDASSGKTINIRISFVNYGTINRIGDFRSGDSGIELDHSYARGTSNTDGLLYFNTSANAFGVNSIHHNVFELPRTNSGVGADGIQGSAEGTDIHDNTFTGLLLTYNGGQHQDGLQPLGSEYIRVYNNYFRDIANYPIFGDAYYGDFNHFWIYNNVVVLTSSALQKSDPPQGIAVGPDGGSYQQMGRWPKFNDVIIANNTIADYGGHAAINLRNNPGQSSTFTNCIVSNNICVNGGGFGIESGITSADNISTTNGAGHFVSYVPLSASNDFHLASGDTMFKDKGVSLSSYFSIDKDSNARNDGAWDIGAYEFGSDNVVSNLTNPKNLRVVR